MNQTKRLEILRRFEEHNPEPTTELIYATPFELLISVILSAQATDVSVNKATKKLYPAANTPAAILALGEAGLKNYIKTIGLFNSKAKNIINTCQLLLEEFSGEVPATRTELESLPGVGRKTANVVLGTLYQQPTIAVDTHVFRVSNRTKFAPGKTPLAVEKKLLKVIPENRVANAHHWLILHGRYTCIARKPKCAICIIEDLCEYPDKLVDGEDHSQE